MKDLPFLIQRSVDIPECLNTICRVDIDIGHEGLAKGLNFLSSTPDAVPAAFCNFGVKTLLFFFNRRRSRTSG